MSFSMLMICALISPGYALPVPLAGDVEGNVIVSPLSNLTNTLNTAVTSFIKAKTYSGFPNSGRQTAILEQDYLESPHIKIGAKYANLQDFATNFGNLKPIVDTIEEHEKYGNTGDKGRGVATVLIGGFEALSNVLNAAIELPTNAAKQLNRKIATSLNVVGEKLVGLA